MSFWEEQPPDAKIVPLSKRSRAEKSSLEIPAWYHLMGLKEGGVPLPTVANALVIFENDPALTDLLAYNVFSHRVVLAKAPPSTTTGKTTEGPFPRSWEEADLGLVLAYFQRQYAGGFTAQAVQTAMQTNATLHPFHPVREWLAGLSWDGEMRLQFWLEEAFGCEGELYQRTIAVKFCVAAVRRVRRPGCKFDSMLILEGAQDLGKSRACRALFGDDWFTDALPEISTKDACAALEGVWGVELGEIEHLIRSEPETVKAFLSRQIERYRPPYGRAVVDRPRQCVLIGTTNRDDYARDSTGNRRYWPIRVKKADVDWIVDNRDQLWAEAAVMEAAGEPLWLDDHTVRDQASEQQAARSDEDPWEIRVLRWVGVRRSVQIPEILVECLNLPSERQDKRAQMRIADLLRRNGWKRKLKRTAGEVGRWWELGGDGL